MNLPACRLLLGLLAWGCLAAPTVSSQDLPDINTVAKELSIPKTSAGAPAAGARVRETTPGWDADEVHHILWLPEDWEPDVTWPVIFEYPGNGGYSDDFDGTPESCQLGYGLTAGRGYIWVCLPFVQVKEGKRSIAKQWWGDVEETKRYCRATVKRIQTEYGGDPQRILLAGFSRGAIACNFIGLHDEEIAKLWSAFFCHSHYDGVRTHWPYEGADRAAAIKRLARLGKRPQWISHEGSIESAQSYLRGRVPKTQLTFRALPYRNHTDAWGLREIPFRAEARAWLKRACPPNESEAGD